MKTRDKIESIYPNLIKQVHSAAEIPKKGYMVYVLVYDDRPIVLGHGQFNRAKVICDNPGTITAGHIKALIVRLHHLFGRGPFESYILPCESKAEAQNAEAALHKLVGGDSLELPQEIQADLFAGIPPDSKSHMALRMALGSAFDGLRDLRHWRKQGILDDATWGPIRDKLRLKET